MRKIIAVLSVMVCFVHTKANETISVDTFYSLPFRVEMFSARVISNNEVKLTFTIAETFTNVTHFEVLRSTNNVDFANIGSVIQTDNSPTSHTYNYTDWMLNTVTTDIVYYKLKQVTSEGRVTYSYILPVKLSVKKGKGITVWPQPAQQELNITFENEGHSSITLKYISIDGKLELQERVKGGRGIQNIKCTALPNLQKGTHIIQVFGGEVLIGTKTFIKN